MHWRLQGSRPEKVLHASSRALPAELTSVAAAGAECCRGFPLPAHHSRWKHLSLQQQRPTHEVCIGVFKAARRGGFTTSSRVLLAEHAPVAAAVALDVVEDATPGQSARKGFTRHSHALPVELASVAAARALSVVEDFLSQLPILAGSICPCSNRGQRMKRIGDFKAARPWRFHHIITRASF